MKKIIAFLAITFLLTSCAGSAGVTNLDASAFLEKSQEANVVVIDVRTSAEYAQGHLANAINIDVEAGNFDSEISNLDKKVAYAVYCRSGRRSAIAAEKMANLGFTSIFNLQNGGFADLAGMGAPTA